MAAGPDTQNRNESFPSRSTRRYDGRLLHCGGANRSDELRVLFYLTFRAADGGQVGGEDGGRRATANRAAGRAVGNPASNPRGNLLHCCSLVMA